MPMTPWNDIVGYTCLGCGKWATHWYFDIPLCCTCHTGSKDLIMEEQAIDINTFYQKNLTVEGYPRPEERERESQTMIKVKRFYIPKYDNPKPLTEGELYCAGCMCHADYCTCLREEEVEITEEEYKKALAEKEENAQRI